LDVSEDVQDDDEQGSTDDEHKEYSDKVQKRISKLVGKLREAERREEAALNYANGLKTKSEELEKKYSETNQNYVSSLEAESLAQIEEAKVKLKKAIEEGNVDVQAEAQSAMAKAALNAERAKIQRESLEAQAKTFAETKEIPQQPTAPSQPPSSAPPPDPKATAWAENNTWFGQDEAMTYTAFAIHRRLVEEEGYDPRSDEYYGEVDRRIREQFPNKFETAKPKKKVDQTVAPAVKSVSKQGKRTVRLTPSQVAIAKKLGVPLEEYAKYVKE
jgi:chromosome segregation ATPase